MKIPLATPARFRHKLITSQGLIIHRGFTISDLLLLNFYVAFMCRSNAVFKIAFTPASQMMNT